MRIAALNLALMVGGTRCSPVASSSGGGDRAFRMDRKERRSKARGSVGGGDDLTEDIDFWTRMTQEIGSLPLTKRPTTPSPTMRPIDAPVVVTPSPVTSSPVTPIPTEPGQVTPMPTDPSDTPAPVTPSPVTPSPVTPSPVAPPAKQTPEPATPVPTTDAPTPEPSPGPITPSPTTDEPTPSPTPSPVTDEPTPSPVTDEPTPGPVTDEPTPSPSPEPTGSPVGLCGLTPEDRAAQFRQLALAVTDASTLDDPSSSQSRALNWLVNEDRLDPPLCPSDDGPCEAVQRYVMAAFYYATEGEGWDQCSAPEEFTPSAIREANAACSRVVTPFPVNNARIGDKSTNAWLTSVDECEWGGVACWGTNDDKNGCMDQIDFEKDGLSGTLIPEMHKLDELRFFILEQGSISGPIPSDYGLFGKLLIFDMDFNDLTGPIPDELFDMKNLQQLDLNDNMLSGELSPAIASLKTLTFLQIDHNELSGNIPSEVGELTNLRIAFFNDNDFTGVMPTEVCANRNNTNPPGKMGTLVADCNPPNDPEVECSCCSSCNVL